MVLGNIAAVTQSGNGSVVTPSLFAICQSVTMGGYGAAIVLGAVQAAGGAVTALITVLILRMESWVVADCTSDLYYHETSQKYNLREGKITKYVQLEILATSGGSIPLVLFVLISLLLLFLIISLCL